MLVTHATTVPPTATHPATCRHCGHACGPAAILTADGAFCCAGCESVFNLLSTYGLTAFYRQDASAGACQLRTQESDPSRFAALDDPEIAARFLQRRVGDAVWVTFAVPALH